VPVEIDADGVRRLMSEEDALLVEVLPEDEYREEHLPDAINIPLKALSAEAVASIDRVRPIIVYCHDDL
jgi:rhodanese-related sulfurtransferase